MTVKFVPNKQGIDMLGRTASMANAMETVAGDIANAAKNIAPYESGDYKDGIDTATGVEDGLAVARVNANDWKSALIEWGTAKTPTFAPLRRAAMSLGLRLSGGR